MTLHGSPELDADAAKLRALGGGPGITLQDIADANGPLHAPGIDRFAHDRNTFVYPPPILYTADSHFDHANIIRYCKRPFASVETMNDVMARNLSDANKSGAQIVHCGDLGFDFARFLARNGRLWHSFEAARHTFIFGNHDDARGSKREAYLSHFRTLVGTHQDWKTNYRMFSDVLDGELVCVVASHNPLSWDVLAREFAATEANVAQMGLINVHGHIHNNALQNPTNKTSGWTLQSPIHFNAGVELHDYKPVTLQDLADAHRAGYPAWQGDPNAGAEFSVVA